MDLVETVLRRDYGLDPISCAPGPRGFVAETFVADVGDGARVFVKWLPVWASAPAFKRGLAVAERLPGLDVPAAAPLRTLQGALFAELEGRPLAVFEFIEGRRGEVLDQRMGPGCFNHDYEPLIELTAAVHRATAGLGVSLPLEAFDMPWAAGFEAGYRRALTEPARTGPQAELARLLHKHAARIDADWADLQAVATACQRVVWSPVLSHGDMGGGSNIIIGADGILHPIDWDDPLLGPAERDAWFFTCNPQAEAAFTEVYRRAVPGWRVDPLLRRYYLFYRFFQDIIGYIDIILDDPSVARQAWSLAELDKTCFQWLWPPMRRLAR